jgi:hypothetical protein
MEKMLILSLILNIILILNSIRLAIRLEQFRLAIETLSKEVLSQDRFKIKEKKQWK